MLWKRKKRWRSTGKDTSFLSANTVSQSKTDTTSSKYYQSISELPLHRFIDCIVDSNLFALVISGTPTEDELAAAWQVIRIEYADAIKDNEYMSYIRMMRDAEQLEILYKQMLVAIDQLKTCYTDQFHKALNNLFAYTFKLDPANKIEYDAELKKAEMRSKGTMIDLQLKQSSKDAMLEKMNKQGTPLTREYYQQALISLSDHAGYNIRSEDITVFQYCDRLRRLNAYNDQIKKQTNGRK